MAKQLVERKVDLVVVKEDLQISAAGQLSEVIGFLRVWSKKTW